MEEINKGPNIDNGIRASSLEIQTAFFSRLVTLWLLAIFMILQRLPRVTWCASVSWRCFRYDKKCLFSGIYNPQITISFTSLLSANFNGNRVKNHLKPWTCPLRKGIIILMFLLHLASQQWHKNVCSHSQSSNELSFYLSLYTKIVTFNFPFNLSNGSAQVCFWPSLQYFTTKQ